MASGNTLTQSGKKGAKIADVVAVKHHDGPILLPTSMQDAHGNTLYDPAIAALMQAKAHDAQTVVFSREIDAFPWEVAIAMQDVLEQRFGSATLRTKTVETFFGPVTRHPQARAVKVGLDETRLVPWGAPFNVPGLEGVELTLGVAEVEGRMGTSMTAEVRRRDQSVLNELADAIEAHIREHSIYRGKALTMRFEDAMPVLDFLDLRTPELGLVYKRDVEESIEDNVVAFLLHPELVQQAGMGRKRGVLLPGPYGTGKSAQVRRLIRVAQEAGGWTCVYLQSAKDLVKALPYLARFGRVLLAAEDLDKVAGVGVDDSIVQPLSLALDGVESYKSELLLICTTNNLDHIHPILRRDGRFDVTIPMDLPDAEAGARLLALYGGELVEEGADLSAAGTIMAGFPPATSREVVARAKLSYIRRTGSLNFRISGEDMRRAALSVAKEKAYTQAVDVQPRSRDELFGYELGRGLTEALAIAAAQRGHHEGIVEHALAGSNGVGLRGGSAHAMRALPAQER